MKISIVVPAFNEERLLAESLSRMTAAAGVFVRRGWTVELIVCDNNSTDRTADIARAAGARVVFEPINQIARARNTGAAAATGDWLFFVDADSHPNDSLFDDAAKVIETGKYMAGGAVIRMDTVHPVARTVNRLWNLASRWGKWLAGSFIFIEAEAFRKVGGFSQEFFAAEELELSQRLKKLARERRKRIVVLHRHPLITSGRKMELYSAWEHIKLLLTVIFNRSALRRRESCTIWYDGRR